MDPEAHARLHAFARRLGQIGSVPDLLTAVVAEVQAAAGYQHAWIVVFEPDLEHARLLAVAGGITPEAWAHAPMIPVAGDAMMEEILEGHGPVVVEDARIDPRTNKDLVEKLGNRTIVNVPLILYASPLGTLGTGSFGDEGCRLPTAAQLEYLQAMAAQISVAAGRLQLLEERAKDERSRADLQRRFLQFQKLESLGLLAGGIAHDFNNLLMVMRNYAQFILDGPLNKEQAQDLESLIATADRGAELTRQLLAMARQQPQQLIPFDLNPRLRELQRLIARVMPANVQVELLEGQRLPTVLGDPSQVDQVFMNLCMNAKDAMPTGGRILIETEQVVLNGPFVAAHPWAKPGRYLLVTVTDTGQGMPPEVLDRIFEPFFTTKPAGEGTGLGLAVAYGIVSQHSGMLHAYSEVGVGTTFKVYLPIFDRDATQVGTKIAGAVPRGGEHVLVAEDDAQVRGLLQRILSRAGYRVTLVEDGDLAVEAARTEHFDLYLLDVVMPRMSGREAFEALTKLDPTAAYLFSSGYTAELLPTSFLRDHAIEVLSKPYDPDALLRAVRAALDRPAA